MNGMLAASSSSFALVEHTLYCSKLSISIDTAYTLSTEPVTLTTYIRYWYR